MPVRPPTHRPHCSRTKTHNWQHTKTTTERGYGSDWQKLRRQVLVRDSYLCRPCDEAGRVSQAHEVDHITPKAKGGKDDPENLQAICRPCHRAKTAREGGGAK